MYHSFILQRMVSTNHGQRRILKKSPPIQKYIRQAVESGTYYFNNDQKQQQKNKKKAPYGSNYTDLPVEYEILTLYPPVPPPPRIPLQQRGLRKKSSHVPTEKLINDYLKRHADEQERNHTMSDDEYYETLLGIPAPSSKSSMGKKSALLNKAYAFALRQYQVMRQDDNMTEQESIEMVNKLLQQETRNDLYACRKTSTTIQKWRNEEQENEKSRADQTSDVESLPSSSSDTTTFQQDTHSYPSILYSKPRAIEGMTLWSQRLKAVPYREWTIGATTALDHWIARIILEMEEDEWQELLEGNYNNMGASLSQGRDIITVRHSLFPETILDASESELYASDESVQQEQEDTLSLQDKSIDELLASLGGFDEDFENAKESSTDAFWPSESVLDEDNIDVKVSGLVQELQEWRARHVKSPYEEWSNHEKDDFASWLDTYVATLSSKREGEVDLVATRKALLESPPINKNESDKFWQQVRDETEAEILLQSLKKMGAPSPQDAVSTSDHKARQAFALFQHLPYDVQLQKLVDLGTLRPILDEYTSESERVKFLARYGEKLMEGVEMEHLVPDREGPIRGDELGRWGEENGIGGEERFRMEKVAYGTDEFGSGRSERAREMYRAWNTHKAGRARFEEIMFKKDRLGLRYNLDDKGKVHTTLQKELGKK